MKYEMRILTAIGLFVAATVPASATHILPLRDSSTFNNLYEGDVVPLPDYTEFGPFVTGSEPSTDGDIMTYRVPTGGGYWDSDVWDGATAGVNGWTIEFRIKIGTDAIEGSRGAVALYTGSGTHGDIMAVGGSSVKILAHSEIEVSTADNTDAFHTFRVAFFNDGGVYPYTIYRDGVELDHWANGGNWGGDTLYFGSAGSPYGGPTVEVDYLRWDDTGAYAPIPEPGVLALLGVGGLLLSRVRGRRQCR